MNRKPVETKLVVVELKIRLQKRVPADWDAEMVNFHLNESSHCLGTEIAQLAAEMDAHEGLCNICGRCEGRYLRDSTEKDREILPTPLKDD